MKKFLLISFLTLCAFSANAILTPPAAEAAAKGAKKGKKKGKKGKKGSKKKKKTAADDLTFVLAKKAAPDYEAVFKKLDTNNDNKLSKEEFAKVTEQLPQKKKKAADPAAADQAAKKKKAPTTDELFTKLDTDNDGYLSLDEFKKYGELTAKKKKPAA